MKTSNGKLIKIVQFYQNLFLIFLHQGRDGFTCTFFRARRETFHQGFLLFIPHGGVGPGLQEELDEEDVVEPDGQVGRGVALRVLDVQQEVRGVDLTQQSPHHCQTGLAAPTHINRS